MNISRRFHCLFLAVFASLLLAACGPSNTVRLLPVPPMESTVLPSPQAARVCVVTFADKREDMSALGVRRDNTPFTTSDDVAMWMSRGLADELMRNGLQVTLATSLNQARSSNPDYLVTGSVKQAWLREVSATELSTAFSAEYALANRNGRVFRETQNASQSKTNLPMGGIADDIMLESLRDLVRPMAQKITAAVQAKQ